MQRTSWEKAMGLRHFKEKHYQQKLLEYEKAQAEENSKPVVAFEKECKAIVERVLNLVGDFKIKMIFIHINEKQRRFRGNIVKVSVTAEGEYDRNVYFHCSWKEAYTLIKDALEKEGIPYEDAGTFDGFVIKIV